MHAVRTLIGLALFGTSVVHAQPVTFSLKPHVESKGAKTLISFAVSAPTDVEVAVLDAKGKPVRHLAAGVLGGEKAPPAPLQPGLRQTIEWDGKSDTGGPLSPPPEGPLRVRVRAGMGVTFGRFVGADPYNFGAITGVVADESGNVYVLGTSGNANQGHMVVRVFDPEGRYLREIVPFPADLEPGAMKDLAWWDEEAGTFRPRNRKSLNPDFYGCAGKWGNYLMLAAAGSKSGVVLTDGTRLYTLNPNGAVRGEKLVSRIMWPKEVMPWGSVPNSGGGPIHLAFSPDGRILYLAGLYSSKTRYGHKYDPRFPPGQVYRLDLTGNGTMEPFAGIDVAHTEGQGGAWLKKARTSPGNGGFTGPVHGLAVDGSGRVYVCDREHDLVVVYDASAKQVGAIPVAWPSRVAVHPETGAVYVLTKDAVRHRVFEIALLKFKDIRSMEPVARCDLGPHGKAATMALSAGVKTVIWVAGVKGGLAAIEDKGAALEPVETQFRKTPGRQDDWTRICVDYERDEVYASDGCTKYWRYNGKTGDGGPLVRDGKRFLANDIEVGYDGLLYTRVSNAQIGKGSPYSGPLWRLTRDLDPAPYEATGTHVLSDYIYSRYGVGYAERGIGPGPNGECYITFMYQWAKYLMAGFGPDGKPIKGMYMQGRMQPGNFKLGQNKDLTSAVIGPMPSANGGIRVGLDGDIYTGVLYWPNDLAAPHGFDAKKRDWSFVVGSVLRFKPSGGAGTPPGKVGYQTPGFEGVVQVYPGLAPFSRAGFGGNTCCVCRVPRFDLDPYGRLLLPNSVLNSVKVLDNAGNQILGFGRYGNFDSQYVNPNTDEGRNGRPRVATPAIPMTWPTAAGFSDDHIYVNDTYSRRVVRADKTWALEESCVVR